MTDTANEPMKVDGESSFSENKHINSDYELIENIPSQLKTSKGVDYMANNNIELELQRKSEHCKHLEDENANLKSQIRSLKQKNNELEDEASNYQSALGIATNVNL